MIFFFVRFILVRFIIFIFTIKFFYFGENFISLLELIVFWNKGFYCISGFSFKFYYYFYRRFRKGVFFSVLKFKGYKNKIFIEDFVYGSDFVY